MYKATTPTIQLTFSDQSLDLTLATSVIVTLTDAKGNVLLEDDDPTVAEKSISIDLSQAETLAMPGCVNIQANWLYSDGSRACSDVHRLLLNDNLHAEVME